jgi:hypothetical protein
MTTGYRSVYAKIGGAPPEVGIPAEGSVRGAMPTALRGHDRLPIERMPTQSGGHGTAHWPPCGDAYSRGTPDRGYAPGGGRSTAATEAARCVGKFQLLTQN